MRMYVDIHSFSVEVGGILLGFRRGEAIELKNITRPAFHDKSTSNSFHRKDWSHQLVANFEWIKSGFKSDWIGEWHSHPQNYPKPSKIDIDSWRTQVKKRNANMVYVIIGKKDIWVGLVCSISLEVQELKNISNEEPRLYSPIFTSDQ